MPALEPHIEHATLAFGDIFPERPEHTQGLLPSCRRRHLVGGGDRPSATMIETAIVETGSSGQRHVRARWRSRWPPEDFLQITIDAPTMPRGTLRAVAHEHQAVQARLIRRGKCSWRRRSSGPVAMKPHGRSWRVSVALAHARPFGSCDLDAGAEGLAQMLGVRRTSARWSLARCKRPGPFAAFGNGRVLDIEQIRGSMQVLRDGQGSLRAHAGDASHFNRH